MSAYAALVSLQNLMETIRNHPHPPITFDNKQSQSLREVVSFLQQFLENRPHRDCDAAQEDLEKRIAEAACATEDAVESHIADRILARTRRDGDDGIPNCIELGKVIKYMDLIKQHVIKIQEKICVQDPKPKNSISSTSLSKPATARSLAMVGFDDALIEIMERLTMQQPTRQILPIVGMGGIGLVVDGLADYLKMETSISLSGSKFGMRPDEARRKAKRTGQARRKALISK